jgi:hypothetical protein
MNRGYMESYLQRRAYGATSSVPGSSPDPLSEGSDHHPYTVYLETQVDRLAHSALKAEDFGAKFEALQSLVHTCEDKITNLTKLMKLTQALGDERESEAQTELKQVKQRCQALEDTVANVSGDVEGLQRDQEQAQEQAAETLRREQERGGRVEARVTQLQSEVERQRAETEELRVVVAALRKEAEERLQAGLRAQEAALSDRLREQSDRLLTGMTAVTQAVGATEEEIDKRAAAHQRDVAELRQAMSEIRGEARRHAAEATESLVTPLRAALQSAAATATAALGRVDAIQLAVGDAKTSQQRELAAALSDTRETLGGELRRHVADWGRGVEGDVERLRRDVSTLKERDAKQSESGMIQREWRDAMKRHTEDIDARLTSAQSEWEGLRALVCGAERIHGAAARDWEGDVRRLESLCLATQLELQGKLEQALSEQTRRFAERFERHSDVLVESFRGEITAQRQHLDHAIPTAVAAEVQRHVHHLSTSSPSSTPSSSSLAALERRLLAAVEERLRDCSGIGASDPAVALLRRHCDDVNDQLRQQIKSIQGEFHKDWQQAKEECALLSSKLNDKANLNAEHVARLGEQLQAVADRLSRADRLAATHGPIREDATHGAMEQLQQLADRLSYVEQSVSPGNLPNRRLEEDLRGLQTEFQRLVLTQHAAEASARRDSTQIDRLAQQLTGLEGEHRSFSGRVTEFLSMQRQQMELQNQKGEDACQAVQQLMDLHEAGKSLLQSEVEAIKAWAARNLARLKKKLDTTEEELKAVKTNQTALCRNLEVASRTEHQQTKVLADLLTQKTEEAHLLTHLVDRELQDLSRHTAAAAGHRHCNGNIDRGRRLWTPCVGVPLEPCDPMPPITTPPDPPALRTTRHDGAPRGGKPATGAPVVPQTRSASAVLQNGSAVNVEVFCTCDPPPTSSASNPIVAPDGSEETGQSSSPPSVTSAMSLPPHPTSLPLPALPEPPDPTTDGPPAPLAPAATPMPFNATYRSRKERLNALYRELASLEPSPP